MALRVTLTGRVALETERGRFEASGLGGLGRLAFAYLVSERRRPVPRDELADVLWGEDPPRSWETSLRVVLSKLRGWLGKAGLDAGSSVTSAFGCYQLHLPEHALVDVEEAVADLDRARAALAARDPGTARAAAAAAAGCAASPFVPGAAGAWVERRQAELAQFRLEALAVLADAALTAGEPAEALSAAEDIVRADPFRESAYVRVMAAHAAAGNRGAALRAYERCRQVLVEELGVSPSSATDAVYLSLLRDEDRVATPQTPTEPAAAPAAPAPPAAGVPPPGAPPAPTRWPSLPAAMSSFVGREDDVAEVAGLVTSNRLVTLLGPGGVGKTRLSLEVAATVAPRFAEKVAFVPLGELSEPGDLAASTAAALGLPPEAGTSEAIAAALGQERALLVLDNCEQLVAAAARLAADLLAGCPGLTVLATSREPLAVGGEVAWPVPSLTTEEGVRLFLERARAADPRLRSGDPAAEPEAVAAVVERLDGIPLAIELAAARVPVLPVAAILARLEDRFALLTGGARTAPSRHQTLRAAVDWTYESLPEGERQLLRWLSVFGGSFDLAAAEYVAGTGTLDLLDALVRRSLIVAERGRFRMLETIRAYAAEKLEASGEPERARGRLLIWALELAREAEQSLDGPEQVAWLERLEGELPNLRAALAVGASAEAALRLAAALGRFWEVRGHYEEGRRTLRRLLGEVPDEVSPDLRARAQHAAGVLAQRQGDYAAARSRYAESLAVRRRMGDRYGAAVALHGLASVSALERDLPTARALYEEAAALGRDLGDLPLLAAALSNLGWVAHTAGDFAGARRCYEEALDVRRELGDEHGIALVLGHLGDLAYQGGDYAAAASLHAESLERRTRLGDRAGRADSLATLGHLALQAGDLATARDCLDESLALRREVGDRAALPGALCNAADLALVAGRPDEARRHLEEAEALATSGRDRPALAHVLLHRARLDRIEGNLAQAARLYAEARQAAGPPGADALTAEWLEGVAATAAAGDEPGVAARLLGAAAHLRGRIGAAVPPHEEVGLDRDLATLRSTLGAGFEDALAAGEALDLHRALAEASAVLTRI